MGEWSMFKVSAKWVVTFVWPQQNELQRFYIFYRKSSNLNVGTFMISKITSIVYWLMSSRGQCHFIFNGYVTDKWNVEIGYITKISNFLGTVYICI